MDNFGIIAIILCIILGLGWILNLYKLFSRNMNRGVTLGLAVRIVGIFIPIIGGVFGWFNFDKARASVATS